MKKIKRVLCMLLVCCLATAILPMFAYAVESHTDVSDWLLSECRFSEEESSFILTEDYTKWDTGSIWYNTPCENDFTLELDYYTGSKNRSLSGADGIAIAFYADYAYKMTGGEEMGFNGSKGYGIELDTYTNSNRGDPNYNHISLIKDSVGNHLITASLTESEDEQWHHLKVVVERGVCTAYVDDEEKLSHEVEKTGHGWIGITSATGDGENKHAVKNIVISGENTGITDTKYLDMKLSHKKVADTDGQYTYEITADITNTAEATAKNMVARLTCDDSISLAEGISAEIEIGNLSSGENRTVTWQVTATWPEKSCAGVYGVTAEIDDASASLWQESYIYLQAKNEYDNSFVFGKDQWKFGNYGSVFDPEDNEDYYLSTLDLMALLDKVSNIERYRLGHVKEREWGGSCYGMSSSAILAKVGAVDIRMLQTYAANLYQVIKTGNNDDIESFVNFYHLQQYTDVVTNCVADFALNPVTERIAILEAQAASVATGGCPVLLGFSGVDEDGDGWGHAIVAYGVEYKGDGWFDGWGWKKGFDARFLLYDCNYPDKVTYLYFTPGTDSYEFEKYNDVEINMAINDVAVLDVVNHTSATQNRYATLRFESTAKRYFLIQDEEQIEITGSTNLNSQGIVAYYDKDIPADGEANAHGFTLVLPSLNEEYTIEPETGEACRFELMYENTVLNASFNEAASLTFSPDGLIAASGTTGDYELSLCANEGYYDLPWYLVTVRGEDSEEIALKQTDDGIVITGSDLKNTTVTVEGQTEIETLSFSTDENEVLVKDAVVETKTVPVVYVDVDGDGVFESAVSNAGQEEKPSDEPSSSIDSSGFKAKAADAKNTINEKWTKLGGSEKNDVADNTMWIIFSHEKAQDPGVDYTVNILKDDKQVYSEKLTGVRNSGLVYVSLDDQLKSVATKPGEYTFIIKQGGSEVQRTTIKVYEVKYAAGENGAITQPDKPVYVATEEEAEALAKPAYTANSGYHFDKWTSSTDGYVITYTGNFAKDSGGGGGGGGGVSSPTVKTENTTNGSFTVSNKYAGSGSTVKITPKADEGYVVDQVVVTDKSGKAVEVKTNSDGTYSFTMPAYSAQPVTVKVTFKLDDEHKDCPSEKFTDVNTGAWYHEGVDYAVKNGLMNGVDKTLFAPNAATTRAQLVTLLYRLEGEPAVTKDVRFSDVPAGQWFSNAISWAAANGVVSGYGDGKFGPDNTITREQIAAMLYRYAQYKSYDVTNLDNLTGYTDAGTVSGWADSAMRWTVAAGIIEGTSKTTLDPTALSTRAQVAVVFMRFCEGVAK